MARAIADSQRPRAGARSHRQGRRRRLGRARARPRAADRHGAHAGAWRDLAAARLCRRRLVGAGRRRRAARAPARRHPRLARRRSVRGARRQDRAACCCRRARHRGRSLGAEACAAQRQSRAAVAQGRCRRRRRARMAAAQCRAVRRRAARCAVLLDRHHPPPSRRALAQGRSRHRRARLVAAAPARPRGRPAEARRHARLLRLLAGTGGGRAADRRSARAQSAHRPQADHGGGRLRLRRIRQAAKATCARCRCICPTPTRAGAGWTAFLPPASSAINRFPLRFQAYWPSVAPSLSCRRHEGNRAPQGTNHAMTRVSIAERLRLSVLIGRRVFRSLVGRIKAHPLLRWRYASATTDRLVIAPQDLRTADATRASEIYGGRFAFAGKVVICDRRSPFEMTPPSDEWAVDLLTFAWLRHLRAADSAITRANARSLIDDWINLQGKLASARLAQRYSLAPHFVLALPGAVRAAGRRRALLPALHPLAVAPGALSAPHAQPIARRPAAAAGGDRAHVCRALPRRPVRRLARQRAPADRRTGPPDPARRRPYQPQSRQR